jgi:hypothetical protein
MKAITVRQPWAALLVLGLKRIETRGWKTNIRERIAVHAAAGPPDPRAVAGLTLIPRFAEILRPYVKDGFPLGCVLGSVFLADCLPIDELCGTRYATYAEVAAGDWRPGRFGWIMENPVLFETPFRQAGSQGFWEWRPQYLREITRIGG